MEGDLITVTPVRHSEKEPIVVSRIIDLLIQQGKEQQELTDYLGIHRNNFTEWKRGAKRSYMYYIDEIATFFDVSPTYLLRGDSMLREDRVLSGKEETAHNTTNHAEYPNYAEYPELSELIDSYKLMTPDQRKLLIEEAKALLDG